MVPSAALPPATPFTDHVTAVLVVPVTVAVNGCVSPRRTLTDDGVTETATCAVEGRTFVVVLCEPPPQPAQIKTGSRAAICQRRMGYLPELNFLAANLGDRPTRDER